MAGESGTPGATPTPDAAKAGATEGKTTEGTKPPEGAAPEGGKPSEPATPEQDEATQTAIRNARELAKRAADERDAARARLKELEEKDLPEAEKTAKRNKELEEENQRLAQALVEIEVTAQVNAAAAKLGVVDAEVVSVLLREKDTIEFDADGRPVNVEAAMKALLREKPFLSRAAAQGADAGAGTRAGATPGGGMNDLIRRAAGRN